MRPVLQTDILTAARALLPLPADLRPALAKRMIDEAEAADRYRQRHRKAHALWGNGTLAASAALRPHARPRHASDAEFLSCQALVIDTLLSHASGSEAGSEAGAEFGANNGQSQRAGT